MDGRSGGRSVVLLVGRAVGRTFGSSDGCSS